MDHVISIIKYKLQHDTQLHNRITMSIQHIITLLEFCLKSTYFPFQDKYYEQVHGADIGSPMSPIVANLLIEEFEIKGSNIAPYLPRLCLRYMDNIFVI